MIVCVIDENVKFFSLIVIISFSILALFLWLFCFAGLALEIENVNINWRRELGNMSWTLELADLGSYDVCAQISC